MSERKTVQIEVRKHHIVDGVKDDCESCAVALAVHEVFHNLDVEVTDSNAWLGSYPCTLPQSARDFIHAFDEGRPVSPLTFNLEVPIDLLPAGQGVAS